MSTQRVDWRIWNAEHSKRLQRISNDRSVRAKVPFCTYYRDLTNAESRGVLRELCSEWVNAVRPPVALIQRMEKRMRFVVFDRHVVEKSNAPPIRPSSLGVITSSDRSSASLSIEGPPLYCVGCAEKMCNTSRAGAVIKTVVTFLGFTGEFSESIKFGKKIDEGDEIHGSPCPAGSVIFLLSTLEPNFRELERAEGETAALFPGDEEGPRPMDEGGGESAGAEIVGSGAASSAQSQSQSRAQISNHVYIYDWDPPTQEKHGRDLKGPGFDLEKEILGRAKVMCEITQGKEVPGGELLRPTIESVEKDRILVHAFLVIVCWSPDLVDWFVGAESVMLKERMNLLCDSQDVALTMKKARIRIGPRDIDFWRDASTHVCEVHENRLRVALAYAKEKNAELPEPMRQLAERVVAFVRRTTRELADWR
jgi:hypothetical protein